ARRRRIARAHGPGSIRGHRCRHVDMDAEQTLQVLAGHLVRNDRAPVAALRYVALVSETPHQDVPGEPDPVGIPAWFGRLFGEAVAGHRRYDDMKASSAFPP